MSGTAAGAAAEPASGPGSGADVRLLPPALAAWLAAWWVTGQSGPSWPALAAAVLLVVGAGVLAVAARSRRRRLPGAAWLALTAAAAAAVTASGAGALAARAAGPWPGWVSARASGAFEGTVVTDAARVVPPSRPHAGGGGWRAEGPDRWVLRVDAGRVTARGVTQQVDLPVLVVAGEAWRHVTAGRHVRFTGRLAAPRPGDEVAAVVTVAGPPGEVTEGSWPWRLADAVRASLRQACVGLPERAGGLLPAIVDGDTSTLPDELRAELMASGLSHLTAVSGANLAIMAGTVVAVAGALRCPRRLRPVLLLVTVVGFVVLARPSPSVLRAAAMGGVAAAAAAAARRPRGVPALAAAVVVLLALHPWLARSAGFVLSAVATGALLLLAPRWADLLARRMPRPLALALAAPAAAQVACAPVVVLLQPAVSVVAVPANLVADPAVAPATVAGVVAAVVGTFSPTVAHLVAAVGALGTGWIALVAATASRLPFASAPWPPGVPGALLLAGLEAVGVALTLAEPRQVLRGWVTGLVPRPSRRAALAGVGAIGAVVVAGWAGLRPLVVAGAAVPAGWSVAMCDVGQGDATLLRSGADRAVLVDAGPEPALADACLRRLGVRRLDLVVLTHFHADHVDGLPGVLAGRDAGAVLVSPLARPTASAAAVQRLAAAEGLPVGVAWVGQQGRAGGGDWAVQWQVIAASGGGGHGGGHGAAGEDPEGSVVNESTVALDVTVTGPGGSVRAVLLGDLETQGQQALAARLSSTTDPDARPVDVVKVAHHGSAKQSEHLYRVLGARVGLVGVGTGNDYGHPAPSALALLRRSGTAALRTDLSGDVVVQPAAGGALLVTTQR